MMQMALQGQGEHKEKQVYNRTSSLVWEEKWSKQGSRTAPDPRGRRVGVWDPAHWAAHTPKMGSRVLGWYLSRLPSIVCPSFRIT